MKKIIIKESETNPGEIEKKYELIINNNEDKSNIKKNNGFTRKRRKK